MKICLYCAILAVAVSADWRPQAAAESEPAGLIFRDDFNGKLAEGWSIEREERSNWRVGPLGLEVKVQPGNMWGPANNAKNVFIHAIPSPSAIPLPMGSIIEISATISNRPTAQWEQADLVWYYDGGNMVKLGQELVTERYSVVMGREEGDGARTIGIVPLDANTVELRLQARLQANGQWVRGQFRTAVWSEWRDVGESELPLKGEPKASLQFYNGPPNEEHWVRVSQFAVQRLPNNVDWPRVPVASGTSRGTDNPRVNLRAVSLSGGFDLISDTRSLAGEPSANYEQNLYLYRDGSYGWHWDRRTSNSTEPIRAGVAWHKPVVVTEASPHPVSSIDIGSIHSLELRPDAVTRLEDDHGDHNLAAVLDLASTNRVAIWFDWYGAAATAPSLADGFRDYELASTPPGSNEIRYRLVGLRGAPPRINLKAFLDDITRRGLVPPQSRLTQIWFGNEIWNRSRGATLITRLGLTINGQPYVTRSSQRDAGD